MLDNSYIYMLCTFYTAKIFNNLLRSIGRKAIYHEYLARLQWRKPLQTSPDVDFLVLGQNDNRNVSHPSTPAS